MSQQLPPSVQRHGTQDARFTAWRTPDYIFDPLNAEFGFLLDAAADADNTKCLRFYTEASNGLVQPWISPTWCNPPYGTGLERWLAKAADEQRRGVTSVLLLPASTDVAWFHRYVWNAATNAPYPNVEVRFFKGRIRFLRADGTPGTSPSIGSVLVVFRGGRAV